MITISITFVLFIPLHKTLNYGDLLMQTSAIHGKI